MGLSSFPTASEGVLPVLLMNTVLSIALVKDIVRSLLQITGRRPNPTIDLEVDPAETSPTETPKLEENIKESISVTLFKSISCEKRFGSSMECTVCLHKFEADEEIGWLSCNHFFHKGCLEKWIDHSHTTCPLCRSSLISVTDPELDSWDR